MIKFRSNLMRAQSRDRGQCNKAQVARFARSRNAVRKIMQIVQHAPSKQRCATSPYLDNEV
jgi:hypothetical protein